MKIALISGHGYDSRGGYDSGAIAYDKTHEQYLNYWATEDIGAWLRKYGHQVTIIHTAVFQDLKKGIKYWQFKGYDYVFEIHFNAFDGKARGTEIYVTQAEQATTVEQGIIDGLKNYFSVRGSSGVKRTDFLVIKTAKRQGVSSALLEICFIDNKDDLEQYYKHKWDIHKTIADKIHTGFGGTLPKPKVVEPKVEENETPPVSENKPLYRVQVGAFHDVKNAESLKKELESKGYKPFISSQ